MLNKGPDAVYPLWLFDACWPSFPVISVFHASRCADQSKDSTWLKPIMGCTSSVQGNKIKMTKNIQSFVFPILKV